MVVRDGANNSYKSGLIVPQEKEEPIQTTFQSQSFGAEKDQEFKVMLRFFNLKFLKPKDIHDCSVQLNEQFEEILI